MAKSRKFSRPRKGKPRQLPPGTVTKESSCAVCRMRKLKCSGGRPACALCIKGAVAEGRLASGVRCLYSASSVHATAADKELEAMLGGRGSKCAWGEKVSVEAPPEGEPEEEEEEEEEAGPSVVERALGPAPFAVYDVEDVDAAGENDPTFPPSSSVDSPPSSFPSTSTAPSTFYLPIPPALAHHIQSAPSLSVPSFPAFPTSAPTTTPRLELPKLGFAPPRARPPVVQPSAPRALRPVVAAAPVAGRSSAALGPPRPPAAPLAVEQEPFIMDDFALFRRTAFAPEPPYAEPASFDFFAPPPPPPPTSTQYHRDPAPARYVDAALPLAFPPAPYRSSYLGPTLHLDTALPSFYDDLPAAPYPAAHTLPHAFPSLMSSSATTGPPPALSGLAAAYLASTPLEPFAAVTAPSLLDGSSSGADAGFECGLGLDLGFEYAPPPPAQTQAQVHGEQLSARGSSATDAAAFFSMFRSDPWVGEQQQQGQGQGFEVGQWEGLGFGGWTG